MSQAMQQPNAGPDKLQSLVDSFLGQPPLASMGYERPKEPYAQFMKTNVIDKLYGTDGKTDLILNASLLKTFFIVMLT